jgi:hypothetical protein
VIDNAFSQWIRESIPPYRHTYRMHTPAADEYDPAGQREHFESGRRHAPDLLK